MEMVWNSSMRSSRLTLLHLLFLWWLEPSVGLLRESHLVSDGHYLCNNYILFMIFGYVWTLLVNVWNKWSWAYMRLSTQFWLKIRYDSTLHSDKPGSQRQIRHWASRTLACMFCQLAYGYHKSPYEYPVEWHTLYLVICITSKCH
jgi:hypothetical protein